jgi:hypothetical protein
MATAADEAFNSPTSLTLPPSKMYHGTIIINKVLTTKKASCIDALKIHIDNLLGAATARVMHSMRVLLDTPEI